MSEIAETNAARIQRLSTVANIPLDTMYAVSLLEFLIGDRLDEAKEYHENRIAPILVSAEANVALMQERMRAQQEAQQEAQAAAATRAKLLGRA